MPEKVDSPNISVRDDVVAFLQLMFDELTKSHRPLLLVGGGVTAGRARSEFAEFARRLEVPVVCSLMGIDVLPYVDPLRAGFLGSYGNRWTNLAIGRSDFLLVLGSRLDIRQTGADTAAFKSDRKVFHVDIDPAEMNNRVTGCVTLAAGLREFLHTAVGIATSNGSVARPAWHLEIDELRRQWPDTKELAGVPGICPNTFMHELSRASQQASTYVVDVGQHQMWAAQSLELVAEQRFITSGGMGSMGFALPAAVGAVFSLPSQPVVLIAGDGGFQANIQELETVRRNSLPLKMVVLNNGCHGMVRQFQESYFDRRYQSTLWGYSAPDFDKVATAYEIPARTIRHPNEVSSSLKWLWTDPKAPSLLQVMIDTFANAYPKIAYGRPMTEMEPFATPIAMEGT